MGSNDYQGRGQIMLTRRDAIITGAAGAAGVLLNSNGLLAKAAQPSTKVNFDVPAGACDCHVHIFGDPAHYQFFSGRTYTPEPAIVPELLALHKALHIER